MDKVFDKYPKTDMFSIVDTIGIPHSYMIGSKHIDWASVQFGGNLHKLAISTMEKSMGPSCCMPGCNLTLEEHRSALVVEVKSDKELKDIPELQEYLQSCVDQAKIDNMEGFAFKYRQQQE